MKQQALEEQEKRLEETRNALQQSEATIRNQQKELAAMQKQVEQFSQRSRATADTQLKTIMELKTALSRKDVTLSRQIADARQLQDTISLQEKKLHDAVAGKINDIQLVSTQKFSEDCRLLVVDTNWIINLGIL